MLGQQQSEIEIGFGTRAGALHNLVALAQSPRARIERVVLNGIARRAILARNVFTYILNVIEEASAPHLDR